MVFYKLYLHEFTAGRFDEDTYINTCLDKVFEKGGLPVDPDLAASGGMAVVLNDNAHLGKTYLKELDTFVQHWRHGKESGKQPESWYTNTTRGFYFNK